MWQLVTTLKDVLQTKEIINKYERLEDRVAQTSNKVVEELTFFIDTVMKPQQNRVERAFKLLQDTLNKNQKVL